VQPLPLTADSSYHYVDYETTVSTEENQQAVTIGELKRSWKKDGRAFFNYQTTAPVPFMFAVSSARYEEKTERYKGVALKLYYHKGHEYNLNAMMKGMKDALDYGNENFGYYPFRQLSLAEIPQYRGAATAYPGVLFSAERISFLSDYGDTSTVNQAYAITVHETAHQWWALKLEPAAVPGSKVLTESLAKYTENVVLEKHYGKQILGSYLRDDNQLYQVYRSMTENEQAMDTVTGQPFVYYQKGGLMFYAIQEMLGEEIFNKVLKDLLERHSIGRRKASVQDLSDALRKAASPELMGMIDDVFTRIITWETGLEKATCKPMGEGRFEVSAIIRAEKYDGGSHDMKKVAVNDSVDLVVYGSSGQVLYRERVLLSGERTAVSMIVQSTPVSVVVDPYGLLLGDDPKNNVFKLTP
jgi:ABC-2 type transport system permease protein